MKALIGYTGFVGSTLLKQNKFDELYRSTNIQEIRNKEFDLVVCAGAPAQKWLANKEPEDDLRKINQLIDHLKTIKCKKIILISTVDIFKNPNGVDENTVIEEVGLNPYGLHRRMLEKFIEENFKDYLIVRLPGLVGPGLKKNIIFDFLNENNLAQIESRNIFQFYPMVNLWFDILKSIDSKLKIIHLTSSPMSVANISFLGFNKPFSQELHNDLVKYDMKTIHADLFDGKDGYQYSQKETLQAVRSYAQSEPRLLK